MSHTHHAMLGLRGLALLALCAVAAGGPDLSDQTRVPSSNETGVGMGLAQYGWTNKDTAILALIYACGITVAGACAYALESQLPIIFELIAYPYFGWVLAAVTLSLTGAGCLVGEVTCVVTGYHNLKCMFPSDIFEVISSPCLYFSNPNFTPSYSLCYFLSTGFTCFNLKLGYHYNPNPTCPNKQLK